MSAFDFESERCLDCDGHFRHFPGCPDYTGEPVLSLAQRVQVEAEVRSIMEPLPEWMDDDLYMHNADEADDYMHEGYEDAGMEAGLFGADC